MDEAIVRRRPEMHFAGRVDQTSGDPDADIVEPRASFQQKVRPQQVADVAGARRAWATGSRRPRREDLDIASCAAQLRDHLFGESVAEVLTLNAGADGVERHHDE